MIKSRLKNSFASAIWCFLFLSLAQFNATANPPSTNCHCVITITSNSSCSGSSSGSATATATDGTSPYTYRWSNGAYGATASGLSSGTYTVTSTDKYGCTASQSVNISSVSLTVNAGSDKTICNGSSTQLSASGASLYSWTPTTGLSDPSIANPVASPTVTTTYTVTGAVSSGELVTNGDFSSGNTGFTSQYGYSNNLNPEGLYYVGSNANNYHGNFFGTGRGGSGKFMIINGATVAGVDVWKQTVAVNPNTTYYFSTWITALNNLVSANLAFKINGTLLGPVISSPSTHSSWIQFYAIWNSGSATSATISIVNQNTIANGNDFGLDDISFTTVCEKTDQVKVTVKSTSASAGSDVVSCPGESVTLTATGGGTYAWSNGATSSSINVSPSVNTTYTVTVTNNGCTDTDQVKVTMNQSCPNWEFACTNRKVEIVGKGAKGNSSTTLTFTDVSTIDSIVVEAVCKNSTLPTSATFTSSSQTITSTTPFGVINGNSSNHAVFRATFNPTSSISMSTNQSNQTYSFIAYVYRSGGSNYSGGSGVYTNAYIYKNTITYTLNVPVTSGAKNLTIQIPFTELNNDSRVANITATAGSVTNSTSVNSYNAGESFNLVSLPLNNVPGNVTTVSITVTSPNSGGDSFMNGVSVSTESCCTPMTASIAKVDAGCKPDTATICTLTLATSQHGLWLDDIPSSPSKYHKIVGGSLTATKYSDGSLHISGTFENVSDANRKWTLDVMYTNKMNWTEWSATGGTWKGQASNVGNNYQNWDYYVMDAGYANKLTGSGTYAGKTLNLTHRPNNYLYAFQVGQGANDQTADWGMSGWFDHTGSYTGNGDINFDADCSNQLITQTSSCNGTADLSVSGGAAPYTYSWSNGRTSQDVSGLCAGSYTVTITDVYGCTTTKSVTIGTTSALSVTCNSTNVTTQGGTNGTASVTVSGGVTPYSYLWNTGHTTQSVTNRPAGVYSVTVTDKNGCFVEYECCIKQPSVCDGFRTQTQGGWGSTPNGGNPGAYLHANFNTAFPSGVTVGCSTGFTLKLTSAQAVTDFLPSGSTARALTANLTNPAGSYKNVLAGQVVALTISVGMDNAIASFGPSTTLLQNLVVKSGTFANMTVAQVLAEANKKLGGCSSSYSFSQLNDAISAINESFVDGSNTGNYLKCGLDLTSVKVDVKCYGQNTGSIDLSVSGGLSPYTYSWSNSASTQDLLNVGAGTYSVTVTDAYGLTATTSATVAQPTQLSLTTTKSDLDCFGACIGTANVTATGGTSPYTYKWNTNATSASISSLCAGTYTVTVTDANGCTASKTATLTQPTDLTGSITKTDVSCGSGNIPCQLFQYAPGAHAVYLPSLGLSSSNWVFGPQGGTIETYANGTARIYGNIYYQNDTTKSFFLDFNFSNKMTWAQWSALGRGWKGSAGTVGNNYQNWDYYIFSTTTPSILTGRNSYVGNNLNITHNPSNYQYGLQIGLAANDKNGNYGLSTWFKHTGWKSGNGDINANLNCVQGQCDGTTDVTVSGGTSPYTYSWNNGATSQDLSGICPGTYTVTVTDSKGCTKTLTATIGSGSELLLNATGTNIACAGVCNGTATVSASGGQSPYTYAWSNGATTHSLNNICAGTYIVTVTDSKGCFGKDTVVITANPKPEIAATATNVNCYGGTTGAVTTAVTGGTAPFSYSWTPSGATTANLTNKAAGTYTVILTDINGCKDTASATITQPTDSLNGTTSSTPVSCVLGTDGTATVVASGGTAPYTYAWSTTPTRTTAMITGLRVGSYTVTITDSKGCTAVRSVTVTGVPPLTLGSVPTAVLCNGGNTGSINLTVNGGTPSYTFQWSNGATTEDISGLTAGTYNVTVTDANGCVATAGVSVSEPQPIVATATPVNIACNGGATGAVNLSIVGGTSPFTYSWSNGATTRDIASLTAGSYSVTITDKNNCTATASAAVTQKDSINVITTATHVSCTGGTSGSITTSVTGGTSPFTYLWSNGAATANISNLVAGVYYLTVTDANGCVALDTTGIVQRDSVGIIVDTIVNATCYGDSGSVTITVTGGTPVCTPGTFTPTTTCTSCTQTIVGNQQNVFITAGQKVCVLAGTTFTGSLNMSGGELVICGTANPSNFSTTGGTITVIGSLNANVINLETALTIRNYGSISTATNITGNGKLYNYGNISVSGDLDINSNGGLFENYGITRVSNNLNNSATTLNNGTIFISNSLQNNGGATFTNNCNLTASVNFLNNSLFNNNGQIVVGVTSYLNGNSTLNMGVGAQHCTKNVHLNGLLHGPATACASFKVTNNTTINGSGVVNGNISYCDMNGIETNTGTINNGASLSCSCLANNPNNSYTYTVLWSTGDTTTTVNGLPAGTYTVTVTDASGCTSTKSITVLQPDSLTATISKTDVSCSANCDGTATLTGVAGGTAPYTYAWSNGATTQNVTALCGGTYTVTITDSKGCTLTKSVVISARPLLVVSATPTAVNCYGGSTGNVSTNVTGGTSPFSYTWNPGGATTANLANKPAGIYNVTVTDANGCTATTSATITQPADSLNGTTSSTPVSCVLGTDGTASVNATGGTAPYTYAWSTTPTRTTAAITGLRVGSYTVTITDSKGCTVVRTVTVTGVPPLTVGSVPTAVLCNGGSTGSINLTVNGGTPGYTFQWSNGATTEDISGLTAGTYNVTVTDANGCVATAGVTVQEPQPLAATATPVNIACNGAATGGVNVSIVGGTSPFTYSWSNGATTRDITALSAGTYSVTVTDRNNCTATASATVTQQAALNVTATPTDVTCYGLANGSIATTVNGGVAPYTYTWGAGQPTTANRSNLAPGTYNVTVTDANNCTGTATATISQPSAALNATATKTDVGCYGESTGTADLTVTGGTAPYTYNWSNGAVTEDLTALAAGTYTVTVTDAKACTTTASVTITQPNAALTASATKTDVNCYGELTGTVTLTVTGGTTAYTYSWSNGATTKDLTALAAGTYTVTVTDAKGCTATASATVTQPNAALSATTAKTDVNCFGGNNGTVTLTVTGGTTAYTYSWSNGASTKDLTGLAAGTYTVTVTDAKACTATASATITQPADSLDGTTSSTPVSCVLGTDGTASVTASGGTAPYTYAWSTTPTRTSAMITGLRVGSYTVTITDSKGCTVVRSVTVTGVPPLTVGSVPTAVLCNGGSTGSINLTVNGGTPGYTFQWSNGATTEDISGLTAGTYNVTVTDANGCVATAGVTVQEPQPLAATATPVNIACNGAATGGVNVSIVGGTSPFTYSWSNGATTRDITGLTAGTYSVTVTDKNNCTATASATVTQQAALSVTATPTDVTCYGLDNGSITTAVNGGVAPYTYTWGAGQPTTANRSNLAPGTYNVTVTDANNCTGTATAIISQPSAALNATATKTDVGCYGESTGTADLTVTGGTAPYTYNWSNGAATADLASLASGTYTVTVTDARSCTAIASVIITQPDTLTADVTKADVSCGGSGPCRTFDFGGSNSHAFWLPTLPNIGDNFVFAPGGGYFEELPNGKAHLYGTIYHENDTNYSWTVDVWFSDKMDWTAWSALGRDYKDEAGLAGNNYLNWDYYIFDLSTPSTMTGRNIYAGQTVTLTHNPANYQFGLQVGLGANSKTADYGMATWFSLNGPYTGKGDINVNLVCTQSSCDGAADLAVAGGTAPYLYTWSNGATTQDLSSLCEGGYGVTVTDANGCTATDTVTIEASPSLVVDATSTNVTCSANCDGTAEAMAVGGTAPYTYIWSNGETTMSVTGLCGGSYSVTVTDSKGCSGSNTVFINANPLLEVTVTPTSVNCFAGNNGTATPNVTGGVAPYTYLWSNGATTANLQGLVAGSYAVTVTDANGCVNNASAIVTQPADSLNGTTSSTPVSCVLGTDGTASVNATGGTAPYTYAWSTTPTRTTAAITGLRVGSYTVTITDSKGCTVVRTVTVTGVPPLTVGSVPTAVLCNGGSTGSINLTVNGGTPGYTFQWSNGATTEDISGLTAGTYNVTVTDANGCVATAGVTVQEPQPLAATATPVNIACNGAATGGVNVSIVGGTSPFTYSWSNGATTRDITALSAGTYSVTVTDRNNCTATASATVTQQAALNVTATPTDVTCYGLANGSIATTVNGGVAPYTYTWGAGQPTTANRSNLAPGTYNVTVTDANNCTGTATATISQPSAALNATATKTDVGCYGESTGTADLTVTGGTAPYTYNWSNGAVTEDLTALAAGTYTVTVTDAKACTTTASVTITQPNAALTASATKTDVNCYGELTGTVTLTVTGGTTAYTYSWSNGATTKDLTALAAGTYTVTVTDAKGCTATASATVTQPNAALSATTAKTDVNCFGGNNGTVTLTVTGGTTAYTYSWSNGASTKDLTGLAAGTYTVSVTDAKACTATASATITQPADSLDGTTSSTPVSCVLGTDGTASVTATGGTAPYTYAWSTTPTRTTAMITGLRVGSYTVTITDSKGCTVVRTVTVTGVPPLTVGSVPTPVLCNGGNTGSINLTVNGGTPGYTFLWSNGATTEDINGLTAGSYNVTVTDANGCVATAGVNVQQPQPLVAAATPVNIACFGANNGGVNLSVTGGTSPFVYSWSNGAATKDITGVVSGTYTVTITDKNNCTATASATVTQQAALSVTVTGSDLTCFANRTGGATTTVGGGVAPYTYIWSNGGTSADLINLPIGTYSVTVSDANGCTGTGSTTLTQPDTLTATATGSAVSCFGDATGTVTLTVTGGTTAYSYAWSNGAATQNLTGLVAGTYSVTITDANGCTATASASVTEPTLLVATATGSSVSCFGDATGTITLDVTGGRTGYTYVWSTGATTKELNGVGAGTYTVTVTDANRCTATSTATITEPALLVASGTNTNVLCNGASTATVNLNVTGGTSPYTYAWSTGATSQNLANLAAGTYTVTVTDANACTATKSFTITEAATLTANATAQDVRCFLGSDGSVNLTVGGGVGPYTYRWSNNATTKNLTALRVGTFTVTVTDANGCTTTASAVVGQPGPLTLGGVPSPVNCFGGNTGSINLTATGGVSPYVFIWSNGATTEDISNLAAGTYNVTVTDAHNCVATVGVNVQQPAVITLSFVGVNVTTNGGSNGSIDLSVVGGTSPFAYTWSNGATTQDLNNIAAGNYCVTVTDVNGCTATGCKTITEPACSGFGATAASTNVNCNGGNNGTASLTITGGTSPFTYAWSNGATTKDLTGLAAGTYTVTITDAVSCVATANVNISQPTTLTATALGTNPTCNGQIDGSVALNVNGGTAPYTYSWNNGATTQNLSGLDGNTYNVTVTDANGCTATASATLITPGALDVSNVVTHVRCFLGNDGAISTTVSGGTAPYTYAWSNGSSSRNLTALRAGSYGLTVTDASGCTAVKTIVVTQPGPLTLGGAPAPVSCAQGNDGSINLTVNGGTAPYNFNWNNGATTEDISGLTAGTYNVTVTDARGCVGTVSVVVQQPAAIVLSANVTDACAGGNSGALQLNVVGGSSPFTYAWSNGASTKNIGSLAPGSYAVTVTDSKGCIANSSFTVGSNVNCRTMEFTIDVFLEGPFETQNMLMQNKLRTQCNTVPLFQPYNSPTMGYNGTESVGSLGNDVVDWVLVSFRTNTDRNSEVYKVAGLLSRDGKVRTITGDTIFQLNSSPTDSLYVVVEHRNHMGVMTPVKMCADHAASNGVVCVDFTHTQSYVTGSPATAGQKVLGTDNQGTVYGMHSGDGDCNFDINSSDFVPFGTDFNKFDIYSPGDFNMDCDCNSNDLPKWLGNFNQFSGVR